MNENLLNFFDKKELETLMTQLENNKIYIPMQKYIG